MPKKQNQKSVPVQEAVQAARNHLFALLPGVEDPLLEEVEISDDDQYWHVTLSCYQHRPNEVKDTIVGAPPQLFQQKHRAYKIFKIDRHTGEVRSMKIRELQNV